MNYKPTLFNDEMVRALPNGKTQIREPVKPQPRDGWGIDTTCGLFSPECVDKDGISYPGPEIFGFAGDDCHWESPFGGPGDRLWVRECWGIACSSGRENVLATLPVLEYERLDDCGNHECLDPGYHLVYRSTHREQIVVGKWRRSIHMPRWASRTTLDVLRVWVERDEIWCCEFRLTLKKTAENFNAK